MPLRQRELKAQKAEAHINLAAMSKDERISEAQQGAEEVQLIHHIFEKTRLANAMPCCAMRMLRKVAIRSWGRYVPWPVVQNLLASGVKVEPQLEEREVSLFFSDMAGFTSSFHKQDASRTFNLYMYRLTSSLHFRNQNCWRS